MTLWVGKPNFSNYLIRAIYYEDFKIEIESDDEPGTAVGIMQQLTAIKEGYLE